MFVVFGLVLLIVFIIIILIKNALKPETPNVQKLLNELQTGTIKNHITNCISEVSMDALEKLGANGGVIYDFQGGTVPFNRSRIGWEYLNHTSYERIFFVRYGVRENTLCNQVNYTIPGFPYQNGSITFNQLGAIYNDHCLYDSVEYSRYGGFYGQQILSKLCSIARESTCEKFAIGVQHALTMQTQLEDYVAQELPKCVNFSAFTQRMPVNITTQSDPIIESTIHNSDVLVTAKYPIKITFEDQKPITKIIDYQTTIRARLGLIYNFLSHTLSMDSQQAGFDAINDYTRSKFWRQGFELKKTNDACPTCELPYYYDDVIEVTDWKSLVNGKPFIFRAAVKNRRPAIDFVEDMEIDLSETNFVIKRLEAYDPDDISTNYYLLSLNFGENRCRGMASAPRIGYVTEVFDTDSEIEGVGPAEYPQGGLEEITGMGTKNLGESCSVDSDCLNGEQGEYADNWADFGYGPITGYYLKCYDDECVAACGPRKPNAYACPNMPGDAGITEACFKGNQFPGRCIMKKSVGGNWESCFHSSSPNSDACVRGPGGQWFVPHGSDLSDGDYHCMWTHDDPSTGCNCGGGLPYPYDREHCFPAKCEVDSVCCETCDNGKEDCGEIGVDTGGPCVCETFDFNTCEDPAPLLTPGPGGGWCERDPRVSDVSTGELMRSNLLWMPVEKQDIGTHDIAILAVDDSGLFDYEKFNIHIFNSEYDDPPEQNCIKECIVEACSSYASDADQCGFCTQDCNVSACDWAEIFKTPGKGPYRDCREVWCTNSENACDDVCADDKYVGWRCYRPGSGGRTLSCRRCTYNIGHSGDPERHVNCHDITNSGACINYMPNCFWIRENQSNTFVESCFNDTMLHTASPPAYIIFN